jgi:hypothetical protein
VGTDVDSSSVNDELPKEDAVTFRGGIHVRRFVGGVGAPIGGHLEVARDHLRFSGLGFDVEVLRQDVTAVRFGPGVNATRISAILARPSQEQFFWLSTKHPDPIRSALSDRGWPIVDDDHFDMGVADEFKE